MQRQLPRPPIKDPALLRYLPKTDRLWFNLDERQFGDRRALNYNAITSKLGLDIGFRTFFAIRKADEAEVRRCLADLTSNPSSHEIAARLASFPAAESHIIPFTKLDEGWLYSAEIGEAELLELAIRVARRIRHDMRVVGGTDSPIIAWTRGSGQCYDRASLIVAAYRLNGIPARIVGRNDFFEGDGGEHWWVEAYIENNWVAFDSTYNQALINLVLAQATTRGVSKSELPAFLVESLKHYTDQGVAVSQITSRDCLHKIEGRIVAAEVDVPSG